MPEILLSPPLRGAPGPPSNRDGLPAVASRPHPQAKNGHDPSIALADASKAERAHWGNFKTDPNTARAEADKALLRACLSGGEAAFSELYGRLAPSLFAMVFEILKHQKDAEDVLQESFVKMWKRVATYDPDRGTVFSWSLEIARNKAIDRLRARQRRDKLSETFAEEVEAVPPGAC
ncbi:MAG: RNA polymerase sigma factor [Chthoniobacterales bacterium]